MWCPQCRYEFKPDVTRCPDCGVPLVKQLSSERTPSLDATPPVAVARVTSELEALTLRAALEAAGIAAVIRRLFSTAYAELLPLSPLRGGWTEVLVRAEDADDAREIAVDILKPRPRKARRPRRRLKP